MLDLTLYPASGARRPETRVNRHLIDGDSWLDHLSPSHGNVVSRSWTGPIQDAESAFSATP